MGLSRCHQRAHVSSAGVSCMATPDCEGVWQTHVALCPERRAKMLSATFKRLQPSTVKLGYHGDLSLTSTQPGMLRSREVI